MKNNKRNLKVYLQYPWKFPDSPYYKYLISFPPKNIEYLGIKKRIGVITNKNLFRISNLLKKIIRFVLNLIHPSMANAHQSPKGNYDLIHCAHCLSKNNSPWVCDMEAFWQLWVVGCKDFKGKRKIEKLLLNKNCKKILPWTNEIKEKFNKEFPQISQKLEVVYPAVEIPKIKKKKHKAINLLFVGRYFYSKGGLHALEVMDRLTKKFNNVRGIVVSEVPKEIIGRYGKNKKIKFYKLLPHEKLLEIYSLADIMIYPGYSDSFGFIFLESMSFGLPIVTVDGCSRKEVIKDKEEGFVIPYCSNLSLHEVGKTLNNHGRENLIDRIQEKVKMLIKNKKLREEMSKKGFNQIKKGKFSIKRRNAQLEKIYFEATKN